MDRRDFMKMCSVAGLGLVATGLPGTENEAKAALEPSRQFFIMANCSGGCDHTLFITPKGNATNSEGYAVNRGYASPAVSTMV